MSTGPKETAEVSPGTTFAHLFEVDADQFQLLSQQPRPPRDSAYLNRPYELSELMRLATDAGVWPRP